VLVGVAVVVTGLAWLAATRVAGSGVASARILRLSTVLTVAGLAIAIAGVASHAARALPNAAGPFPPPETPNVVLISIDTLRPDHLGGYGYSRDTSPALDALAAGGARFTTAVSPTSWTLPAHVTLLTALPPEVHGVVDDRLRLGAATVTLAEILRARGYATAGFVSGPYLDAGYGFARGFDHYDDWSAVRLSHPAVHRARTSPALFGAVEEWLGGWQDGPAPRRPFFVFIHAWDVHYDFNPPPPYDTLFDPEYAGTTDGLDFETGSGVHAGMPARDLAHVVALYDGEIRYVDDWIGRFVQSLRRRAVLDDTIVVVTSDHGEEFFEHGMKGHRNALYEESIRVPLIIHHPARIRAGTVVDRQVRLMDVAPTVLDLTGTALPPTFGLPPSAGAYAARSLVPLLDGRDGSASSPPSFASLQPHAQSAIRHETRKLILTPFAATAEQLFDLATDPAERANLAGTDPTSREALRAELTTWHDAARAAARNAEAATMSEDHEAALRALGYIE
jgi:arylsulfatase A-like enzyme